jgi:hypothetical protein
VRLLSALSMASLVHIDLARNSIGDAGARALASGLNSGCSALRHLNLDSNALSDASLARVCRALHGCRQLESLVLRSNAMEARAAAELAVLCGGADARVGAEPRLGPADASVRGVGSPASSPKSGARLPLPPHDKLAELDVSWNRLGGAGGAALFKGIALNSSLTCLDVSWNGLGSAIGCDRAPFPAVLALCDVITRNTSITHLDLSHNRVDFGNSRHVAAAMQRNQSIVGLHVGGNAMKLDAWGRVLPVNVAPSSPSASDAAQGGTAAEVAAMGAALSPAGVGARGGRTSPPPSREALVADGAVGAAAAERVLDFVQSLSAAAAAKSRSEGNFVAPEKLRMVWEDELGSGDGPGMLSLGGHDSRAGKRIVRVRSCGEVAVGTQGGVEIPPPSADTRLESRAGGAGVEVAGLVGDMRVFTPKQLREVSAVPTELLVSKCWICSKWRRVRAGPRARAAWSLLCASQ